MFETVQLAFIQQVRFYFTCYLINTGLKIYETRNTSIRHYTTDKHFYSKEKKKLVYFIKLPLSKGK